MIKVPNNKLYYTIIIITFLFISIFQISSAQEATSIELSIELSVDESLSGDLFWANGTALYDNGSEVEDSEVLIKIKENEMQWKTKTDSNGIYEKQISATGRFKDQIQSDFSEYTDGIRAGNRVGQSFIPNVTTIHSIDIYLVKFSPMPPSPSSSFRIYVNTSLEESSEIGNVTLEYPDIENGWNNFAFPSPLNVVPGNVYYILLTSNTTQGSYRNYGRPWNGGTDYVRGEVFWDYGTHMKNDTEQDIGFVTYYEEPLLPGEYTINVTVAGVNSSGPLYGYNETTFDVIMADLHLTDENLSLIYDDDPPLEDQDITISMSIQNIGDASASDFLVNFSMDSEDNIIDSQTVSLNPLEIDIVSTIWSAEAGDHFIYVIADSTELILEIQENNNNASIQIFVDGDNDKDGIGNISDKDDDNDGYTDRIEIKEGSNPLDPLSKPADNDGDFRPDSTDKDDDNDGYSDDIESTLETDPFDNSSIPDDYDGDYIPDTMDSDMDNDGVLNEDDIFPYNSTEWLDTDFDNIGDNADDDDDADGIIDSEDAYPFDTDDDGLDNDFDWDDDADGILDWEDDYLLDTDNDGQRNDVDTDDDGDGLTDSEEEKKNTNPLRWDTDGDGISDKADYDPLDSDVTSEPEFPMIYLIVPLIVILIFILSAFLIFRMGSIMGAGKRSEGFQELPLITGEYEAPKPQPREGYPLPVSQKEVTSVDELAGLEEEFEAPPSEIKDELADIEEEFEETMTPPPKQDSEKKKPEE